MNKECCKNCVFYKKDSYGLFCDGPETFYGSCRRYPPKVYDFDFSSGMHYMFTHIGVNVFSWCGEYKPKQIKKKVKNNE